MSYKKLFWGVILIVIGVLFILKNIGAIYFDWSILFDMWPLFIILWGISIIPIHAMIRLALSIAAVIVTFAIVDKDTFSQHHRNHWWDREYNIDFHDDHDWDDEEEYNNYDWNDSQKLIASYEDVKYAKLNFDAGAGVFTIDHSSTENLAAFYKEGNVGRYSMKTRTDGNAQYIDFKLKNNKVRINSENHNSVNTVLHPDPIWDFDFDIGAAEVNFDLSDYKVKNIDIDGGASALKIKLGQKYNKTHVTIDAGAADILLKIPKESGARVETSTFLSGKSLNGFNKKGDHYITDNYDDAENIIKIEITAAISSFTVEQY